MKPLRIALLAYRGHMRCGGQGVYLWHLARELSHLGHLVDVWVGPPVPDPMPFVNRTHIVRSEGFWDKWFIGNRRHFLPAPVYRVFKPLTFYELAASWIGFLPEPFLFSLRSFRSIAKHLRFNSRYDIVHDVQSLGYGLLAIKLIGIPIVSTLHHPLSIDRRACFRRDNTLREAAGTAKFFPIGMQAFVARHIQKIITSSNQSRIAINRDFRVPIERICDIGNGVDIDYFCPDAKPRIPKTLLCVARANDPNKGVRDLVEALALLPQDVNMVLVDDASTNNPARYWARDMGCLDRLHITGPLPTEALLNHYRRSTLAVVPSHNEGFGLPAAEAMACGTPVIGTTAGAIKELLGNGVGMIVPPANPNLLAQAVESLLDQPEIRKRMGEQGRDLVCSRFSWPSVATRTLDVYREVIENNPQPSGQY